MGATALDTTALVALMNRFLEAERAGARTLTVYLGDHPRGSAERRILRGVQADEAHNCALLGRVIERLGGAPSHATGAFLAKAIAVQGRRARLEFLVRGLRWIVREIDQAVPTLQDEEARRLLGQMRASHQRSIAACEGVAKALGE